MSRNGRTAVHRRTDHSTTSSFQNRRPVPGRAGWIFAFVIWMSGVWIAHGLLALCCGPGGEIGHPLKSRDELGTTIGIARVIESVDTQENMVGTERFSAQARASDKKMVLRAGKRT